MQTQSKATALAILEMFDPGVVSLISGVEIDRPFNAISLTPRFHRLFGTFEIFFEPVTVNAPQHTYKIDSTDTSFLRNRIFPITRTLFLSPDRNIDPPSPRLFKIHRAIVHILHLSGAGEYSDKILQDIETIDWKEDGSSALGHIISLKMGGWLDGVSVC